MMRRVVIIAAVAICFAAAATGCSWITVKPPPRVPPLDLPVDCTVQRDAPVADVTLAVLLAATGAWTIACPQGNCRGPSGYAAMIAGPILAIPSALSAGYGFRKTRQCRELRAQQERWWAAAREPRAGAAGFPCRSLPTGGSCDPGLACVADVCVGGPDAPGAEGEACRLVHGTTAVYMCHAGLRCAAGRCVRLEP